MVNSSIVFLLISRLCLAISIIFSNLSKNSFLVLDKYPILGRLIVTTPILPVKDPDPKRPPPPLLAN